MNSLKINKVSFYNDYADIDKNKKLNGTCERKISASDSSSYANIPFYAFKSKYCPSFGKYKKVGNVNLIDKETGDNVRAALKKERIGDYVTFRIYKGKDMAGYLDMKCDSLFPEGDYVLTEPDNVIPEVQHLRSLAGDKYAGIGTALINAAVEESSKRGKGGCLWATTEKGYARTLSFYRSNQNPIPFYYKLGFKSPDTKTDEFITKCINDSEYDKLPDSTILLLTPEAIKAKNKYFVQNYTYL